MIAVVYTISPMTVWFAAAIALLFVYAVRGIRESERRWLLGLLWVGLAARMIALVGFFFLTFRQGSFAVLLPDEGYIARRSMWLRSIALESPIAPSDLLDAFNPFAESGMLYVLAHLQLLIGPAPYGVRLLAVTLYFAAAVISYRMVRPTFGAAASFIGLAIVLFLPTAFVWSISTLKEVPFYLLTAISLSCAVAAVRAPSMLLRLAAIATCVGAIVAAESVRTAAAVVLAGGVGTGLLLTVLVRQPRLRIAALTLALVAGGYAVTDSRVQAQAYQLLRKTIVMHIGHVKTPGRPYKLLDPEFYTRLDQRDLNYGAAADRMRTADITRYLIRAALSFPFVPLPWQLSSLPALVYLPQQIIWCVLVMLAVAGTVAGLRRDALVTLLLACTLVTAATAVTLTSGNIGTFVRHRDMTLVPMAWLSGLGVVAAVEYIASRCHRRSPERLGV